MCLSMLIMKTLISENKIEEEAWTCKLYLDDVLEHADDSFEQVGDVLGVGCVQRLTQSIRAII